MIKQTEIITYLVENNPPSFNYNKACEEAVEFQEVLIKMQTKHPDRRPDPKLLIGEYGDFLYRGFTALLTALPQYSADELDVMISKHIEMKLGKLEKYRKEGKYTGGL